MDSRGTCLFAVSFPSGHPASPIPRTGVAGPARSLLLLPSSIILMLAVDRVPGWYVYRYSIHQTVHTR